MLKFTELEIKKKKKKKKKTHQQPHQWYKIQKHIFILMLSSVTQE